MATYNGGRYLVEQLASIAAQTVPPTELVICDDQSTDDTAEIVARFAATAPFPVRFEINAQRLGYARNFMRATELCRSDTIAFSDQDDIWEPTKLAEILDAFAATGALLVSHDLQVAYEDGRRPSHSYFRHLRQSGLPEVIGVKGCGYAIRRDLLHRVGWPAPEMRHRWSHDLWVCLVANLLDAHAVLDRPLIRYRIHGTNTSPGVAGGRDRLRCLLRRIPCPPLTSRTQLDALLAYFFKDDGRDVYLKAIEQSAPAMTEHQLHRARRAYANRVAFLDFQSSPAYAATVPRIARALALFLRGTYRTADGFLGLTRDILGHRQGRI